MNRLAFEREALARLCRRHHITRLSLFGSVLKGSDRPDSDVDLLVEFEPGRVPGLLGLAAIETELSEFGTFEPRLRGRPRCSMPPEDRVRLLLEALIEND